ncbi:hypothetical protein B484DRAFT_432181 [Ochromonadaceae sp. CCMP2298]|nr:hypothetical protein B484DRAFT_432181 [Ochromonadaceae sp. CCMP2298]
MPKGKGDVIQSLQETIIQLGHELDEEREENLRKSQEITQITQMLVEKERLVAEGAAMLQGAQRNNELLKERAEVALREKIEALGELGHLKQTHVEDGEKAKFQVMELEVSLNTLQTENQHLKVEIAEMSGDAEPAARPKESDHTPKKRVITGMSPEEEDERRGDGNRDRDRDSRDRGDKGGSGTPRASSVKGSGSGSTLEVLSAGERQGLWESASSNFASLCVQQGLGEEETGELLGVWEGYAADSDRAFAALEERTASSDRSNRKRLKDLEEQRSRLEKDLQGRVEKMVELQLRVDNQSSGEEDEGHLRSLQQRLEQLVAVHRQLLRKFASLELESVELKKKTQLRDERIRQLEASGRGMISNIRVQAEKHLGELGALREQMVILRSEHEYRVEQYYNI